MADGHLDLSRLAGLGGGLAFATVAGVSDKGEALVRIGQGDAVPAVALCPVSAADAGRQAAVLYENNDPAHPVIVGLVTPPSTTSVTTDGDTVKISAEKTLELTCGKASLRMTADGRITLRGGRIVSHASGANRIRGGSVQLN